MNKKAQGISLNVIIIAAIALLVLVVLIVIFSGRIGIFNKGVEGATGTGTACPGDTPNAFDGCPKGKTLVIGNFNNVDAGKICCSA